MTDKPTTLSQHEQGKYEALARLADKQQKRIADLEAQLAEAQRREELLRAVAEAAYYGRQGRRAHCPICAKLNGHDDECEYKAAIDGVALEAKNGN